MSPKELRTLRLEAGWTQQQLAEKCNLTLARIRAFEEGEAVIDCDDTIRRAFTENGNDGP